MAYNLSTTAMKRAKDLDISIEDLITVDLRVMGWSEDDAYKVSHPVGVKSEQMIRNSKKRFYDSQTYERVYAERKKIRQFDAAVIGDDELPDIDLRDKSSIVRELNSLASQTTDAKLRTEILMKLADLQQMKKDATDIEEDPIRFYLPISDDELDELVLEKARELIREKVGK